MKIDKLLSIIFEKQIHITCGKKISRCITLYDNKVFLNKPIQSVKSIY